jgi:hypothetical protein
LTSWNVSSCAEPDAEGPDADPEAGEPVPPPMVLLATAPTNSAATRLAAILTITRRAGAMSFSKCQAQDTSHKVRI